jgi:hypothetical protein
MGIKKIMVSSRVSLTPISKAPHYANLLGSRSCLSLSTSSTTTTMDNFLAPHSTEAMAHFRLRYAVVRRHRVRLNFDILARTG